MTWQIDKKNKTKYNIYIISFAGIHPHDSKSIIEEPSSWYEFETIASQPECVAIGPCGLDYQRDFSGPDVQKSIFEKQLLLAEKLGKPVLIHERSAQMDVLDMLEKYVVEAFDMRVANDALNVKCSRTIIVVISNLILLLFVFSVFVRRFPNIKQVVIRCFMGTIEEGSLYLERGYYLGFTGYLCKVNINMTNDDLVRIEYIVILWFLLLFRTNPIRAYENCWKMVHCHWIACW